VLAAATASARSVLHRSCSVRVCKVKADYAACLLASGSAVVPGVLSWARPLVAGLVRPSDVHDLDG
jgi:hypothetical protein